MKIPFVDYDLYNKTLTTTESATVSETTLPNDNSVVQTHSRSSTIIPPFIGRTIAVYTGKRAKRILIKENMLGYKLGSFVFTKKLGKSIHNSEHNRKKIAKMKRKITQKKVRKTTPNAQAKKKVKKKK